MNFLKKAVILTAVFAVLFCGTPATVLSATPQSAVPEVINSEASLPAAVAETEYTVPGSIVRYESQIKLYSSSNANADVTDTIIAGLLEVKASIDISRYSLPWSESGRAIAGDSMSVAIYECPDLFYVSSSFSFSGDGTIVTAINPTYRYANTIIADKKRDFDRRIDEIVALCDPDADDFEAALFFHDYIVGNFTYDLRVQTNSPDTVYDPYNMLKQGTGVCQAYTLLYTKLLTTVGINATYVACDDINHIWNAVEINGSYYHVDVTWDDPVGAMQGQVMHNYFMYSTAAFPSHNLSTRWQTEAVCDSVSFDNGWLHEIQSAFVKLNNSYYLIKDKNIVSIDTVFSTPVTVYSFSEKWLSFDNVYEYMSVYSGLSTFGGKLYFNTYNKIMEYNPSSGAVSVVFTYDCADGYIYGTQLNGNELEYMIYTSPQDECYIKSDRLTLTQQAVIGDGNGDFIVNSLDVELLRSILTGAAAPASADSLDLNGDGILTLVDLLRLRRFVDGVDTVLNVS